MKENYFLAVLAGRNVKENYFLGAYDGVNLEEKFFLGLDRGGIGFKNFSGTSVPAGVEKKFLQGMERYRKQLEKLKEEGNLRSIPKVGHFGQSIECGGRWMYNLSSNDYLGLASRADWQEAFIDEWQSRKYSFSSSSSRLLTGNFEVCDELEALLAVRYGREAALLFNSGYHANTGILPALADKQHDLILADKLVHASLIDGIRLSGANFRRYRHNDMLQLETLLSQYAADYDQVFVVTESIFSMDGDVPDLRRLVALKRQFPNVVLYVDEAHAVGVRGATGLGMAEEMGCMGDIDLLVGTFGKALASMGAYVVCSSIVREYLVNRMRPLIFSTMLPPVQVAWTRFVFERLPELGSEREHLKRISRLLSSALQGRGGEISASHIIPFIVGENEACIRVAEHLQNHGFYCLPIRQPTVPQGTARIRFSLTANQTEYTIQILSEVIAKI